MKRTLSLIAAFLLAMTGVAPVRAADPVKKDLSGNPADVPNQIIVELRPGAQAAALGFQAARIKNFRSDRPGARAEAFNRRMERFSVITLPAGVSVEDALKTYRNHPAVASVSPNARALALATPNDAQYGVQWHLHNTGQTIASVAGTVDADVDAPEAWDIETGATNSVIVAIIDSGVDYTHPDLTGRIWSNPNETVNGLDDDGNGIIDDVRGANFVRTSGPPSGDPLDDFGHGTHLAGTMGGATNNNLGISGVSWNVKLMPLKFLNNTGSGDISHAIEAIQYAVVNGAQVINNSWGTTTSIPALAAAVSAAHAAGVVQLAATGNQSNSAIINYPAGYPEIIAVAATNNRDLSELKNFGSHIDLSAPGAQILATGVSNTYIRMTGSSMASAVAAGAAALLKSRRPSLTPTQVRTALVSTVDVPAGWNTNYGAGRLNINKALLSLGDLTPPTVSITTPANGATLSGASTIETATSDNVAVSSVTFFLDGVLLGSKNEAPFEFPLNTFNISNGPHTLRARAYDAAGNNALSAIVNITVFNDTTAPTVSITSPANGATVSGTVNVMANASDNVGVTSVSFYIDGNFEEVDISAPYEFSFNSAGISEGGHLIEARAIDGALNQGTASITVNVLNNPGDTTPPTVSLTSPVNGATLGGSVNVTATASDNQGIARVDFFIDGALAGSDAVSPYTYPFGTASVANGAHTLRAQAFDAAGNDALSTLVTVTVFNDISAPTVAITSPSNGDAVNGQVLVAATATDDVAVTRVEFYVDGTLAATDAGAPYSFAWDAAAAGVGSHALLVKAFDAAGNEGSSSISVTVSAPPAQALGQFNPLFNPARGEKVSIPFDLTQTTHVKATVIDRYGVEISVIADRDVTPGGFIDWNGRNGSGELVASGTYIVMIETGGAVSTRKVIVRK